MREMGSGEGEKRETREKKIEGGREGEGERREGGR